MNKMILFTNHNKFFHSLHQASYLYGFKKFKFDFVKAVNPLYYMHVFRPSGEAGTGVQRYYIQFIVFNTKYTTIPIRKIVSN